MSPKLMQGLMNSERGVILGVANNRSIAWGIAKASHDAGAEIALAFQGDALKKRVEPLADMSRGVTGEGSHVGSGYRIVGMKHPDAPDISKSAN